MRRIAFSPYELRRLRTAVAFYIRDLNNTIVTCPDEVEYRADLDDLEKELKSFRNLEQKITK